MSARVWIGIVVFVALLGNGVSRAGVTGDVNNDGKVDLAEALYALKIAAGELPGLPASCIILDTGLWATDMRYTTCDVARYNGNLYIVRKSHQSTSSNGPEGDDPELWAVLALQGQQGLQGDEGPAGSDGISCWDSNANGVCDTVSEDMNQDGQCTAADCQGPLGSSVDSAEIVNGTIVDADVSSNASISTSKLSGPLTAVANSGLGILAGRDAVSSGDIVDGTVVDADIDANARISAAKIENGAYFIAFPGSSGQVWKSDGWGAGNWGSDNVDDADADPANEIQTLGASGNSVTLSFGGGSITVPYAIGSDQLDGRHYSDEWPTTLNNIQTATSYDFHAIGGSDDDTPDDDSEVPDNISIDNNRLFAPVGTGNVGIGTRLPTEKLEVAGTVKATAFEGDGSNISGVAATSAPWSAITGKPSGFVDNVDNIDDADADPSNEIQTLGVNGSTITLSSGGSVVAPYALNADKVDGQNYSAGWPTTLANIKTAAGNDFHAIGGVDDDQPDSDSEVPDALSIDNGRLYAPVGVGNVGIGILDPDSSLQIKGQSSGSGTASLHIINSNGFSSLYVRDDGNIGINTTNPTARMEVGGTIKATAFAGDGSQLTNLPLPSLGTTIESNEITDGTIVNNDLAADAAISAAKIENGQYFINSAGVSGQVWKSDGAGAGGWGLDNVDDADNSVTNELQVLGVSGSSVTLTNGGIITVPYATSAGSAVIATSALGAGDADTVDSQHYNSNWPTTLVNIQTAVANDFHAIGGIDDDSPDDDSEVPDNISINNSRLYAPAGPGNVGINTLSPGSSLQVKGSGKSSATSSLHITDSDGSSVLLVRDDGRIGINNINPTTILDVSGVVKATSFIGDGSGITGIGGTSGGVTNSGSTTIEADNDVDGIGEIVLQTRNLTRLSVINNGNVGIGTTSPTEVLEVAGTVKASSFVGDGTGLSGITASSAAWGDISAKPAGFADDIDNINDADADPANEIQILGSSGNTITLNNGGGSITAPYAVNSDTVDSRHYNTNWPTTLASVQSAASNDFHTIGGDDDDSPDDDSEVPDDISINNSRLYAPSGTGNVGIGTLIPAAALEVKGGGNSSATGALQVTNSNGTSILYARDDGNVGINATSPGEKLEVGGSVKATAFIGDGSQLVNLPDPSLGTTIESAEITDSTIVDEDISAAAAISPSKIRNGEYFIDSVGNPGQVWKSDGAGAGGWGADNVDDADSSTTNELQVLGTSGNSLTLSKSGGSVTVTYAVNAGQIDGHDYSAGWPTTLENIQNAAANDFHAIGGADDDTPDDDSEVPDSISINNGRLFAPVGTGNVGIGKVDPSEKLEVVGTVKATAFSGNGSSLTDVTASSVAWGNITSKPSGFNDNIDNVDDADASPTNEIQTLGSSGNLITLSNGGSIAAPFAADADTVDGQHYNANWPTTLATIKSAVSNDFHSIGGADDDQPDSDAEVPDSITINNGGIYSPAGSSRVGINTLAPQTTLDINGVMRLAVYQAQPFVCDSTVAGAITLTTAYKTCVCNGSEWVETADGQTSCAFWSPQQNVYGMTFNLIPAGTFTMGSPDSELGGNATERPEHEVTISQPFYMMTTEVTQGQWQAVMGSNPSLFSACGTDCPVEQVSWDDAQTFVATLNTLTGKNYRLPTEAEWEYAARAGSTTAYANGDITLGDPYSCELDTNLNAIGWYCGNSGDSTHPAAQKQPNSWGLYDMHGNVWEWVADWYGPYTADPVTDPTGAVSGIGRVMRGGCYLYDPSDARSAARTYNAVGVSSDIIGFRLVLPAQ